MHEKTKKIIVTIEGIFVLVGAALLLTYAIMNLATFGSDHHNYVPSIMMIIMCGISLLITVAMFAQFKKNNADKIQSTYDYVFNSICIVFLISGMMYSFNSNIQSSYSRTLIFAIPILVIIYLSLYGICSKLKKFKFLKIIPYILLISLFGIFMYINKSLFNFLGSSIFIISVILAIINSLLIDKTKVEENTNNIFDEKEDEKIVDPLERHIQK